MKQILRFLILIIYFLFQGNFAFAKDGNSIIKFDCKYIVVIPNPIKFAIKQYDSEFIIWMNKDYSKEVLRKLSFSQWESPSAIIGKFTSYKKDMILTGHNKTHEIVIAVTRKITPMFIVPIRESREQAKKRAASFYRVIEIHKTPIKSAKTKPTKYLPSLFLSHKLTWPGDIDIVHGFIINRLSGTKAYFHWDKDNQQFIKIEESH